MAKSLNEIIGDYRLFIDTLVSRLKNDHIDVSCYEMDHVCFRCETLDEYTSVCSSLVPKFARSLGEISIGGRPITTVQLIDPIVHSGYSVSCIEVPAPKPGSFYRRGLEHAEFVIGTKSSIGSPERKELERFVEQISSSSFTVNFDTRAIDKALNADVSLVYEVDSSVSLQIEKPMAVGPGAFAKATAQMKNHDGKRDATAFKPGFLYEQSNGSTASTDAHLNKPSLATSPDMIPTVTSVALSESSSHDAINDSMRKIQISAKFHLRPLQEVISYELSGQSIMH